jgi:hypothetical protein
MVSKLGTGGPGTGVLVQFGMVKVHLQGVYGQPPKMKLLWLQYVELLLLTSYTIMTLVLL